MDNFLSFIYIKGFLKSYAQYLGLDSEKLLKEYINSQKAEIYPAQGVLEKERKAFVRPSPFLFPRIALTIVVSLALILYFRFVIRHISQSHIECCND